MIELENNIIVNNQELGEILNNKILRITINTRILRERLIKETLDYHDNNTMWVLTTCSFNPDEYDFKVITDFQKTSVSGAKYYVENYRLLEDINNWMCSINYNDEFALKIGCIYHNISAQMFSDCSRLFKELLNEIP